MNCIETVKFDFRMQNEAFARELYGRWDKFFALNFERIADAVLSKHDIPSETFQISQLQLELGTLPEDGFDEQFAKKMKEQLEESLLQCIHNPKPETQTKRVSQATEVLDLLKHFLLHGTLPGYLSGEMQDIHHLFERVLRENGQAFKQFLQTYGHYTSLQERLVCQFNDPELEKTVHLLSPESGAFICAYVQFLRVKHQQDKQPEIRETDYRNAVWQVVYSYLLTNSSSYFDRKTFVAQTILRLAANYNLTYDKMLELITGELHTFSKSVLVAPELLNILMQLREELSEKHWKLSVADATRFYKLIYNQLKKNAEIKIPDNNQAALVDILSEVETCREFLHPMNEPEIIRLVAVVIPAESTFVLETAKSLDAQKDTGALQGKTGGEFRLLKWQIIFPVLFENKGAGFNRKSFVSGVFKKISAHYNLEMTLLLNYFLNDLLAMQWMSRELKEIIFSISSEAQENRRDNLATKNLLDEHPIRPDKSYKFFKQSEEEIYQFVKTLFSIESEFIIVYAKRLDKVNEVHRLQGKSGGEFREVKWRFIFTVLNNMPASHFNRRYFVSKTLHELASHYNLTYFDLLQYFQNREVVLPVSMPVQQVLDELYQQEKKRWTDLALKSTNAADRIKLLAVLSSGEQRFVKTYLKAFERYHTLLGANKALVQASAYSSALTWHFIFDVLIEFQHLVFNKRQFVGRTIQQLASHYNLNYFDVLKFFAEQTKWLSGSEFAEITAIIQELYVKETNKDKYKHKNKQQILMEKNSLLEHHNQFFDNAGIVLLSPFLPALFLRINATEKEYDDHFKSRDAQIRSMFALQYLVCEKTEFPETAMKLTKLLTGYPTGQPIPQSIELTEAEKRTIFSLISTAASKWERMGNSVDIFRIFLQRDGKLEEMDDYYLLTMRESTIDVLLDTYPWPYKTIKYPWMDKPIQVKWR